MVIQVCLENLRLFERDFDLQNLYHTIYKLMSLMIVHHCFYLFYLLFQIVHVTI